MHHPNIRSCLTLYNDISWFSDDEDRMDRLIALLGEPITKRQFAIVLIAPIPYHNGSKMMQLVGTKEKSATIFSHMGFAF